MIFFNSVQLYIYILLLSQLPKRCMEVLNSKSQGLFFKLRQNKLILYKTGVLYIHIHKIKYIYIYKSRYFLHLYFLSMICNYYEN